MRRTKNSHIRQMRSSLMKKRVAIYCLVIFFLTVARCSFFARIDIFPASPDLVLGAIAVIALTDSMETAAITGVLGGVIADAVGGTGMYLSPVLYLLTAVLIGIITRKMMPRYLSFVATFPAACLLMAGFTVVRTLIFGADIAFTAILRYIILPEFICTLIFALPLYPIIKLCISPIGVDRQLPLK